MKQTVVKPYNKGNQSKKQEVTTMFDAIAGRYDLLNHLLTLNIDKLWRRKALNMLASRKPATILDIATGTGDLAIAALRLKPKSIVGLDISPNMIQLAKVKVHKKHADDIISLEVGDSEALRFADNSFDAVTVGFGVRNFGDLEVGLSEMLRVTKPGGTVMILEFSKTRVFWVKQGFALYSRYVIPFIGKTISKDSNAYSYLPESIQAFPEGKNFLNILTKLGYKDAAARLAPGGLVTIYTGSK
jgi:demethylmenaquinone methyltransferase/2-methoxy-6-polyprenyl-1,4-benzoquinol methylase